MEAVAVVIRTIVILTLATGSVFLELDKPGSSACFAQEYRLAEEALRVGEAEEEAAELAAHRRAKLIKDFGSSLEAFGHISEHRWATMIGEQRKAYVEILEQCEKLGIITVNWGARKGRSFPTWEYISAGVYRAESELRLGEFEFGVFRPEEPELRPEEAARFQIAEILLEEGKYAEAVNELEFILASTASEEVKNLARARISTIYAKMGLDEKSEGELKKIIETTTNLELKKRALITLAGIYRSQKRYDEAVATLRRVIELTQPDVMKLLQFRKEFMPPGFTLAAVDPDWPITENPGWLTQEGLERFAESYDLRVLPKRAYVCFFDKKAEATDDLYYLLLEFEDYLARGAALSGISTRLREHQSDKYFGRIFAPINSDVLVLIVAERDEYIPAAKWLCTTFLRGLPERFHSEMTRRELRNEDGAIKTLRTLFFVQEEYRMADRIDQDNDGAGEYAFLQELWGKVTPPGHATPHPKFSSDSFESINASGAVRKDGYFFKVYLPGPDPAGPAVGEAKGVSSAADNADAINQRENRWVCYGWPKDYGRTGSRAFVVNQAGKVFVTLATVITYDGTAVMPEANAAFLVGTQNLSGALADGVGVDGNTWHPVK